jgi:hypothetical protein
MSKHILKGSRSVRQPLARGRRTSAYGNDPASLEATNQAAAGSLTGL